MKGKYSQAFDHPKQIITIIKKKEMIVDQHEFMYLQRQRRRKLWNGKREEDSDSQ